MARNPNLLRAMRNRRLSRVKEGQPAEAPKGTPETMPEALGLPEAQKSLDKGTPPAPKITTDKDMEKQTEKMKDKLPETMKPEEISARIQRDAKGEDEIVLLHRRVPVFVIPAQSLAAMKKEVKGSRGIVSRILVEVAKSGIASVVKTYHAKQIGEQEKVEAKTQDVYRIARTNLKRCLALAFTAMGKNLLGENPFKHHLFEALEAAGIEDPVPLIEDIYAKAMTPTLELAFLKADEYSGLSDEAFVEVEGQIEMAGSVTVRAESRAESESAEMRVRATQGSVVPLSNGSSDPMDEKRSRYRAIVPRVGALKNL